MEPKNSEIIDVSVIIVNYNSFHLLKECLDSLIRFTKDIKYKIIIVDNNSTEGDVAKVISIYDNVVLIKNKVNLGFAAANNIGIEHSKGKYFLFINNDIVFNENTVKKIFNFAESINEDVFIGCKLLNLDGSHQVSIVDFDNITNSFGENFFLYKLFRKSSALNRYHLNFKTIREPIEVDIIKGAFMFCSSSAIKKLSGFDSRFYFYGEEADLCYRFKELRGRIFYFPNTCVIHVGGASADRNEWLKFKNQHLSKIKRYQKHIKNPRFTAIIFFYYAGLLLRIPTYLILGLFTLRKKMICQAYFYFKILFNYPRNEFN
jgi:GT2 family glycosyltransferase